MFLQSRNKLLDSQSPGDVDTVNLPDAVTWAKLMTGAELPQAVCGVTTFVAGLQQQQQQQLTLKAEVAAECPAIHVASAGPRYACV